MKKRILAMSLCLIMAAEMTGCGATNGAAVSTAAQPAAQTTAAEQTGAVPSETTAAETAAEPTQAESGGASEESPEYEYPEDFFLDAAQLIQSYDTERFQRAGSLENMQKEECYTARLIVYGEPDFEGYETAAVLKAPTGEYIVQFYTPEEAKRFRDEQGQNPKVEAIEEDTICTNDSSDMLTMAPAGASAPVTAETPDASAPVTAGSPLLSGDAPLPGVPAFIELPPMEAEGVTADGMADDILAAAAKRVFTSWGTTYIGAPAYGTLLQKSGVNSSIIVAVVDTGVDYNHPFLKGHVLAGIDYVAGDKDPMDESGHGTHVSGTILDCTLGLNVRILPVRVLGPNGGSSYNVAQGIRWAADNGASVINLSLGGPGVSTTINNALQYAHDKGVVICVSAGNDGKDCIDQHPANTTVPGVIVVSAFDSDGRIADFSNYGKLVDVGAPGVKIASCYPGDRYVYMNGTSMACPHVSAAAAMACMAYPTYSPIMIEQKIQQWAKDMGAKGWDEKFGYGGLFCKETTVPDPNGVQRISIRTSPTKRQYTVGDKLDTTGLRVDAYLNNGTVKAVEKACTFSPTSFSKAGTQTVTISYKDKKTTFSVTVQNKASSGTEKQPADNVKLTLSKTSGSALMYCDTDVSHCGNLKCGVVYGGKLCWQAELPTVKVTGTTAAATAYWEVVSGEGTVAGRATAYAYQPGTLVLRAYATVNGKRYYSENYTFTLYLTRTFTASKNIPIYSTPGRNAVKTSRTIAPAYPAEILEVYVDGTAGTTNTNVWLRIGTNQWISAFYWL